MDTSPLVKQYSLNYNIRKQEALKIDQENLKIAKRIVGSKPAYCTKNYEQEFVGKIIKKRHDLATKDHIVDRAIKRNNQFISMSRDPSKMNSSPKKPFLPDIGKSNFINNSPSSTILSLREERNNYNYTNGTN